ncbi:hypothetical protein RUND412_004895 [Rhizina undulata]
MSKSTTETPKDAWNAKTYSHTVAPFVPKLTTRVMTLLAPSPSDTILDLGCGDGILTSQLSAHCASITGLDASANMIASAISDNSTENSSYRVIDCARLHEAELAPESFTKVFSNAALHWILRDPTTRAGTLAGAYAALKPGGVFVAEMGGHGNVAEVHAALISALLHRGIPASRAREASPWFFPSEAEMRGLLEGVGFSVELLEVEYRPTELTKNEGGGLEGWVRLFGDRFLEVVEEGERDGVVREVCEALEAVTRRGDGVYLLGYVRLRLVARKPE